jgi:hypothetical protein
MNAERESFEPARRSTFVSISEDNVIEVFSFILLLYYQCAWKEWKCDGPPPSVNGDGRDG